LGDPPVVLVTGASSGIGKACARRLAASGFRVFGSARSAPVGGEPFPLLHLDVRDNRSVNECVSRILQEAGRIDVLVNCAGVAVGGSAEEMLMDEIQDQVETNLLGLIRCCRAVLPGMRARKTGLIVNMGSLAGQMGVPFQSAYSAAKHGVEGYSESLAGKDSPYRKNLSAAMHSQAESELRGWNVERIARLVERVVRSRRPRFRYTPGPFVERIAPVARRIIPDRLFLSILSGFYGVK